MKPVVRWGVRWQSKGSPPSILWDHRAVLLFHTRSEARKWITEHYGYIRTRPDLRGGPWYWRMPRAVRVLVTITEAQ